MDDEVSRLHTANPPLPKSRRSAAHLVLLQGRAGEQICNPANLAQNRHTFLTPSSSVPDTTAPIPQTTSLDETSSHRLPPPPFQFGDRVYSTTESTPPTILGRRRRSRHTSPSASNSIVGPEGTFEEEGVRGETATAFEGQDNVVYQQDCLSPSPKRRRLTKMRADGLVSSTNGFSEASNGSSESPSRKGIRNNSSSLNGSANGDATALQPNGSMKSPASSSRFFGHDREEVTRVLIQGLQDLGYNGAASALIRESGYEMESAAVAAFRSAVLDGQWEDAERILGRAICASGPAQVPNGSEKKEPPSSSSSSSSSSFDSGEERLLLAENADKNEMLFYLRQQKFLELLEARDLGAALMVLRGELTPLNYDIERLHALSRLACRCPLLF